MTSIKYLNNKNPQQYFVSVIIININIYGKESERITN
jgi:hypothetical protein